MIDTHIFSVSSALKRAPRPLRFIKNSLKRQSRKHAGGNAKLKTCLSGLMKSIATATEFAKAQARDHMSALEPVHSRGPDDSISDGTAWSKS